MQEFEPEEIKVNIMDKCVVVEGNYEERQNVHNFTSRHFVRRFLLPDNAMAEELQCHLSSNGILTIKVARGDRMTEFMGTEHAP